MTELTWETATEWDTAVSESGVVHESVANTDHSDASIVKMGYSAASPSPSSGVKAYWPLHEDSGSTAYDFGPNGYDGTISGATVNQTGILGTSAYSFDGTDDEITTTDMSFSGDFSASCWINPATIHQATIIGDDLNQSGWFFATSSDGGFFFGFNDGANNCTTNNNIYQAGNWYHSVAVMRSGTEEIWINATQEATLSSRSTVDGGTVRIGHGPAGYMDGRIAEMRLYNRALSSTEIQTLYDVVDTPGSLTTATKTS